jgi:hypothetical protein
METSEFVRRAELFDRPGLIRKRPGLLDRWGPKVVPRPRPAVRDLVRWHWSYLLPIAVVERYLLWRARLRYRLDIEQIEIDEIDDLATGTMEDDSPETIQRITERHRIRRTMARFHVATRERRVLERLARRWDVDAPPIVIKGEVDEKALAQVRRSVREARWTFYKRGAELLVPILSLLVALAALMLGRP